MRANPISCAIGKAVLEVMARENLQQNCLDIGGYLLNGFRSLMAKHDIIGDVRGKGLITGIELVKDRGTKEAATEACVRVWEHTKTLGLLIGKGGFFGNVLRIKPPMCLTRPDVDFMIDVLDSAFSDL